MLTASPVTRRWSATSVARDDLAGVDPRPDDDADAELGLEVAVQVGERLSHLGRGPHRAERVVLVDPGDAEDRHDRVADELLDGAAVRLQDGLHPIEVALHGAAEGLGIEVLAELRRPGHVAEEDRDGLAGLSSGDGPRRDSRRTPSRISPRGRSRFHSSGRQA